MEVELIVQVDMTVELTHRAKLDVIKLVEARPELWVKWRNRHELTPMERVQQFVLACLEDCSADDLEHHEAALPRSGSIDEHETDVLVRATTQEGVTPGLLEAIDGLASVAPKSALEEAVDAMRRYDALVAAGHSTRAEW